MKKLLNTRVSENSLGLGLLIFRLGVASLMLVNSGYPKLVGFASKASNFKYEFLGLGSTTSYSLLVFAEFFCAAFIIVGLFTRLACIPLIIAMGVALFSAHKGEFYGEGSSAGLFLICFITILILGPGKVSVDRMIGK